MHFTELMCRLRSKEPDTCASFCSIFFCLLRSGNVPSQASIQLDGLARGRVPAPRAWVEAGRGPPARRFDHTHRLQRVWSTGHAGHSGPGDDADDHGYIFNRAHVGLPDTEGRGARGRKQQGHERLSASRVRSQPRAGPSSPSARGVHPGQPRRQQRPARIWSDGEVMYAADAPTPVATHAAARSSKPALSRSWLTGNRSTRSYT